MKRLVGLATVMLLAACSPLRPATDTPIPDQPNSASTCLAAGGTMKQVGKLQHWKCITPYADAGKSCTDSSQCQGDCQIPVTTQPGTAPITGTCQTDNNRFGCSATVVNGQLGRALCID